MRSPAAGFTLLELLAVLALLGIVLGVALARLGGAAGGRGAAEAAEHLRALVALASEQAVVQGTELGIRFRRDGYGFLARAGSEWQPVGAGGALRPRRLPAGLALRLQVEGVAVELDDQAGGAPQVILWSSGELTPFALRVQDGGEVLRLVAGEDGTLAVHALSSGPGRR